MFSIVSCNSTDCDICGTWKDISSKYKGDIIEVKQSGDTLIGISIVVSQRSKEKGFIVGDLKWKNIIRKDSISYHFETLGKRKEGDKVVETDYFPWGLKFTHRDTIDIFYLKKYPNRRYLRVKK